MTQDVFHDARILIADGKASNAKLLRAILSNLDIRSIVVAEDTAHALDLLISMPFDAVFCDEGIGPLDAIAFAIAVRHSSEVRDPRVPIIIMSKGPQRRDVELGRDSGINDFIVRPISPNVVKRKLASVLVTPKSFVQTDAFCGPDRRRKRDRRALKTPAQATQAGERRKKRLARRSTDASASPS